MSDSSFVKGFERGFRESARRCGLAKGDRILVACSGGKDSTLVLHLLNEMGLKAQGLIIDLRIGRYSEVNLRNIRDFCREKGYNLHVADIREEMGGRVCYLKSALGRKYTNCHICGVVKRRILNQKARVMGFTKLATGHNLDDEAQTILMNLLNGTLSLGFSTGMVSRGEACGGLVPRAKPFFYTMEKDIRRYSELLGLRVQYERCPCAAGGQRFFLRDFLNRVESGFPGTKKRVVDSYLAHLGEIRKGLREAKTTGHSYCMSCGEPCTGEKCHLCAILGNVKN